MEVISIAGFSWVHFFDLEFSQFFLEFFGGEVKKGVWDFIFIIFFLICMMVL